MTNSTIRFVYENIKKYRLQKGLTQDNLSEIIGISTDYLSEIERGKKTPSLKKFICILETLDVPVQNFFEKCD